MAYPDAQIFQVGGDAIVPVAYTDTEHFTVTRDFLANHRRMLGALLAEQDREPSDP